MLRPRMFLFTLYFTVASVLSAQEMTPAKTEMNKEIVKNFYQDLWINNKTNKYQSYVADNYIVHDIGDRKGVVEKAIRQKEIADFFWKNGNLKSRLDFQIAESNLVATRWVADFEPKTLVAKLFIGAKPIPIINVFRIENGKIVEIWNHRHDIDTNQTLKFVLKGLLIGLLIALFPAYYAFKYRRTLKSMKK